MKIKKSKLIEVVRTVIKEQEFKASKFPFPKPDAQGDYAKHVAQAGKPDQDGGDPNDDKVASNAEFETAASNLNPSQKEIKLGQALGMAISMIGKLPGPFKDGPGGNLGAVISKDNYIMDGRCLPKRVSLANQSIIPWFFNIVASPTSHPIARNVEPVNLEYANEIQFVGKDPNVVLIDKVYEKTRKYKINFFLSKLDSATRMRFAIEKLSELGISSITVGSTIRSGKKKYDTNTFKGWKNNTS